MFRRSICRHLPLIEAKKFFFDVLGEPLQPPTISLTHVLEVLREHYRPSSGGEDFVEVAMRHVIQLDHTDEDSERIAAWRQDANREASPMGLVGVPSQHTCSSLDGNSPGARMVLELMRVYPHNATVREICCRCLANMCQLSAAPNGDHNLAEALVQEGAVEQVLDTATIAARLSEKGRSWTALAILNLICFSRTGVSRAADAGGESVLSDLIGTIIEASGGHGGASTRDRAQGDYRGNGSSGGGLARLGNEACVALDAALGALTGVLVAEAPDNAQGVSYNYEKISYGAVDAVVYTMLLCSALLVRDGRDNSDSCVFFSARRRGSLSFHEISPFQQTAIVELMPLLHKAWMALCYICKHAENIPMVCESLYASLDANQGGEVECFTRRECDSEGPEELRAGDGANRQYTATLMSALEAALFLLSELEGQHAMGATDLAKLQKDLRLFVMECMSRMTAIRTDMPTGDLQGTTTSTSGAAVVKSRGVGVSVVLPTPAALGVANLLASGGVSSIALTTVVRLLTDRQAGAHRGDANLSFQATCIVPWAEYDFHLLCRSLSVLSNLAGTDDEVARSTNVVAALQLLFRCMLDVLYTLPRLNPFCGDGKQDTDLVELFQPLEAPARLSGAGSRTDDEAGLEATSKPHPDRVEAKQARLTFMQHASLLGQVYAVLWGILRTPTGVRTVAELGVVNAVKDMQHCLSEIYVPAMEKAILRYGTSLTPITASSGEPHGIMEGSHGNVDGAPGTAQSSGAAEYPVHHLVQLGDQFISYLDSVSRAP